MTTAGEYAIKFIGRQQNGASFAEVISASFEVTVGMPYKLAFNSFVGTAFAGVAFAQNPAVSVVDRGGNVVTQAIAYAESSDLNSEEIKAVLTHCPFPSLQASADDMAALLQPTSHLKASIIDGVATFEGLYLNHTGYPYQITFSSGLVSHCLIFIISFIGTWFDIVVDVLLDFTFIYFCLFYPCSLCWRLPSWCLTTSTWSRARLPNSLSPRALRWPSPPNMLGNSSRCRRGCCCCR